VARVVVIASSELDRERLGEVLSPDDELIVVVPAVEQSRLDWLTNDEDTARARAADVAATIDREAPTRSSSAEVKPDTPAQLVADAIAEHAPDRIVLALDEGPDAPWLEQGELDAVPDEVDGTPIVRISS
jgi:hypothetical protein